MDENDTIQLVIIVCMQMRVDRSGDSEVRRCATSTPRAPAPEDRALPALPDLQAFSFTGNTSRYDNLLSMYATRPYSVVSVRRSRGVGVRARGALDTHGVRGPGGAGWRAGGGTRLPPRAAVGARARQLHHHAD